MDFSSFSYFSNILSEVSINIFSETMCPTGLYKAFWCTGSAFTHNHKGRACTLRQALYLKAGSVL